MRWPFFELNIRWNEWTSYEYHMDLEKHAFKFIVSKYAKPTMGISTTTNALEQNSNHVKFEMFCGNIFKLIFLFKWEIDVCLFYGHP